MTAFVKATVYTTTGDVIDLEYNTWGDVAIYGNKDFNPTQKFLDAMENGEELVTAMKKWFMDALDNTEFARECVGDHNGAAAKIESMARGDMSSIKISSLLDCEEEGFGSEITYDFVTKKRKRKNTGWTFD